MTSKASFDIAKEFISELLKRSGNSKTQPPGLQRRPDSGCYNTVGPLPISPGIPANSQRITEPAFIREMLG